MDPTDISDLTEKAKQSNQKTIGLTMAIVAVLLALATMLGHRTHTEELLIQTKANDQWAYYQAKIIRSHMYEANADMAVLINPGAATVADFKKRSEDQRQGADEVQAKAKELERDGDAAARKANRFDTSEIFLEIAIVLCSISLLTGNRSFWLGSFISTALGIAFMAAAFLMR